MPKRSIESIDTVLQRRIRRPFSFTESQGDIYGFVEVLGSVNGLTVVRAKLGRSRDATTRRMQWDKECPPTNRQWLGWVHSNHMKRTGNGSSKFLS